jgi:hypothetical protein
LPDWGPSTSVAPARALANTALEAVTLAEAPLTEHRDAGPDDGAPGNSSAGGSHAEMGRGVFEANRP